MTVKQIRAFLAVAQSLSFAVACERLHLSQSALSLTIKALEEGLGGRLYRSLLQQLRSQGLHLAIAGIALPNAASIALHQGLGFEQAATFHQVGWKADRWLDVGYWELRLNEGPPVA